MRKQTVEFKTALEQFAKSSSFLKAYISGIDAVMEAIDKLSITDVQEVRHGRWIREHIGYGVTRYKCSVCGGHFRADMIENFQHNRFCSDCGARMDGEENG